MEVQNVAQLYTLWDIRFSSPNTNAAGILQVLGSNPLRWGVLFMPTFSGPIVGTPLLIPGSPTTGVQWQLASVTAQPLRFDQRDFGGLVCGPWFTNTAFSFPLNICELLWKG